jgi:hypothetical protein
MRTAFAYTSARIIMFGASVLVLYWAGARGILLLGLALIVSALLSYVLLNKQRQIIAARLNGRLSRVGQKAGELSQRLNDGTRAEDDDDQEEDQDQNGDAVDSGDAVENRDAVDAEQPVTRSSRLG